jgi:hypothetical protein
MASQPADPTQQPVDPGTVLFICEHGSAKSVVAAAHFNRLAAERGLGVRAVSRGTAPDPENHPAAVAGLGAEGLAPQATPVALAARDLAAAARVIAFSPLPDRYGAVAPIEVWTVPPVSEDYATARDAIVGHVERLIDGLARRR